MARTVNYLVMGVMQPTKSLSELYNMASTFIVPMRAGPNSASGAAFAIRVDEQRCGQYETPREQSRQKSQVRESAGKPNVSKLAKEIKKQSRNKSSYVGAATSRVTV